MNHFDELNHHRQEQGLTRVLRNIDHIERGQENLLNLSSNDYLGIAQNEQLQAQFMAQASPSDLRLGSASSRLLTGTTDQSEALEQWLEKAYGRSALTFGSGYHANAGIIQALSDTQTLIIADKLVHASIIEGMQLSKSTCIRFKHNDLKHLKHLLGQHAANYRRVLLLTEAIFSMDGDKAPLLDLIALKADYPHLELFLDEAHSLGVRGKTGLGLAQELGVIDDIDYLLGTMGKALGSSGAFLICQESVKKHLINTCRTFIFTTAPAPINQAWSLYALQAVAQMQQERAHLQEISLFLRQYLEHRGLPTPSNSHIIPIIIGDNHESLRIAEQLQALGIYALPVRPPTVPAHGARLRISLSSQHTFDDINRLTMALDHML